jgi:hypothetical protein
MNRLRVEIRRIEYAQRMVKGIALIVTGLIIGALIGMAMTTAEAMPAFLADAQIRARG